MIFSGIPLTFEAEACAGNLVGEQITPVGVQWKLHEQSAPYLAVEDLGGAVTLNDQGHDASRILPFK